MHLHNVLVAQHSSLDGQAICAKLSPDSASNGPYIIKDRIIYQNNKVWVPKELQLCVMTEHHNPPLFGHPSTKKLPKLVVNTAFYHVSILPLVGHFKDKYLAFAFVSQNELMTKSGSTISWFLDPAQLTCPTHADGK
ncbi:hypothetical protein DSO57_1036165 [Entomophthora muscae]|uniref:Uncharacterized protein n=1 Tax=Entomophthora muscae TaxID=34485 RepID=A0ACC2TA32_9FUNG|nr:hypothetical protein DSO57_1036165 [Entomophthora muscae]